MVRRLRMLTAGPSGEYSPGQILIIEAGQAGALVHGGHATYTDEPAERKAERPSVEDKAYRPAGDNKGSGRRGR